MAELPTHWRGEPIDYPTVDSRLIDGTIRRRCVARYDNLAIHPDADTPGCWAVVDIVSGLRCVATFHLDDAFAVAQEADGWDWPLIRAGLLGEAHGLEAKAEAARHMSAYRRKFACAPVVRLISPEELRHALR